MATKTYKVVIDVDSQDVEKLEQQLKGVGAQVEQIEQETSGLSMDKKFKAATGAIKVMTGALAGAVGTLGLLGVESEVFGEFEKKAASAIAVAMGFRDIAEGFNDLRVALNGVTVAQLKANAAALANPYVLAAAAVAGLTVALANLGSTLTGGVVSAWETFVNMAKNFGNIFGMVSAQSLNMAENLVKVQKAADDLNLDRTILVMKTFGQDTLDLEIKRAEDQLKALEQGSKEYDDKLTEILVLRAQKAKKITDKEISDAKQAEIDKAKAKMDAMAAAEKATREELARLQEKWKLEDDMAKVAKEWDAWAESTGETAADAFAAAFKDTVAEEFDPNSIFLPNEDDLDDLITGIKPYTEVLKDELDKVANDRERWQGFAELAGSALQNVFDLSQSKYERTLLNLERERNNIEQNISLTENQRIAALEKVEEKEKAVEIRRIKAERDQFTLKQTLLIAETVMNAKFAAQKEILMAKQMAMFAAQKGQEVALEGVVQTGKAGMSLGSFVAALGPFGIAAFAASIGGIIASIIAAKRKANAAIGAAQSAGSGGASVPSIPTMNSSQADRVPTPDICATPTVKAYVLSGDARSAQEADAKLGARRTIA